jgi:hypothetical protein
VGPGVVPQARDSNYLQCQTTLTAITGAKGVFPRCQTGNRRALMFTNPEQCPLLGVEYLQRACLCLAICKGHSHRQRPFSLTILQGGSE